MLEFRLLGPVEALADGQPIALKRRKQKALLALLLLSRGQVVSTDRLIDRLWGERPPATAREALQNYVAQLRKALGPEVVVTRAPGYVLQVDAEQVDLGRFERLTAAAKRSSSPSERASLLHDALALWKGPALADLESEDFAHEEGLRLEELRRAAAEDRIDAELALGRHGELVGELEQLVRDQPLRERLRAQLMLALYRSGRQADALGVYADARRTFVEELGLEPSPVLKQLEQAILRQDPALDAPEPPAPEASTDEPAAAPSRTRRRRRLAALVAAGLVLSGGVAAATVTLWPGPAAAVGIEPDTVGVFDGDGNLVARAPVGATPSAIAIGERAVWVAEFDRNEVVRVDPARWIGRQTIDVGAGPSAVAVGGGFVWVANSLDGTVSRIDPATNHEVQRLTLGGSPAQLAYGGGSLWVANPAERSVTRLDPATGHTLATIPLDGAPGGIAAGAGAVWVTSPAGAALFRIDPRTNEVVRSIAVGAGAGGISVHGASVWVANADDGTVSRVDPVRDRVIAAIAVEGRPVGVAAGSTGVWVTSADSGRLTEIDPPTNEVLLTIRIGNSPGPVALGGKLWVATSIPSRRHRGGTLRIVSSHALPALDPATANTAAAWQIEALTGDGLVGFERIGGPASATLVPDLARALATPTRGATAYHFELRPGLRYSDGRPVRASDMRRALERVFRLGSPGAAFYAGIVGGPRCLARPRDCILDRGVVTDDTARTIAFRLLRPDPDFEHKLALPFAQLVPGDTTDGGVTSPPAGTGPYRVKKLEAATDGEVTSVRLERNRKFRVWSSAAQPDGFPDRIEFQVGDGIGDAVFGGKADLAPAQEVGTTSLDVFATRAPGRLHATAGEEIAYLSLNTRTAPFDSSQARRALSYAVDRSAAAGLGASSRLTAPACQVLPQGFPGFRPYCPYTLEPGSGRWTGPDIAKAEALVASSGTRGAHIAVPASGATAGEGRLLVKTLRQLGYRATLSPPSARTWQLRFAVSAPAYPSPSAVFAEIRACGRATGVCDSRTARLYRDARSLQSSDPGAAARLWSQVDRRIVDGAEIVPLSSRKAAYVTSRRVGNYQYHLALGVLLDQLWVKS